MVIQSPRRRALVRGIGNSASIILFIIAFGYATYFVLFFQDCIRSQDCDFTKFLTLSDPLIVAIIGIALAIGLPPIQHILQKIRRDVDDAERCAELRKQLIALKRDYELMKCVSTTSIFITINQKNTRLVIINNLVDLLRHHYNEELNQDLSLVCEKGIRFPCSSPELSINDFRQECDILIPAIDETILQLGKKPHDRHQ